MSKTLSLRVDEDLLERFRAAAEADRRSLSQWILLAAEEKLDRPAGGLSVKAFLAAGPTASSPVTPESMDPARFDANVRALPPEEKFVTTARPRPGKPKPDAVILPGGQLAAPVPAGDKVKLRLDLRQLPGGWVAIAFGEGDEIVARASASDKRAVLAKLDEKLAELPYDVELVELPYDVELVER